MPSNNLRMFKELCGEDPCHKVILATTMWDMVHEAAGEAREQEFKLKYWKTMLVGGSTTSRFLRTRESAFTLIDPLISATKKRSSVLLQQEMVDRHKKHPATSAGHVLSKMELPVRQREELPNRIRNQMKRADGDKVALEEHEELKVNLESKVDGKQRLKLPLGRCFAKMTGKFLGIKPTFMFLKSVISRTEQELTPSISFHQLIPMRVCIYPVYPSDFTARINLSLLVLITGILPTFYQFLY